MQNTLESAASLEVIGQSAERKFNYVQCVDDGRAYQSVSWQQLWLVVFF